MKLEIVTREVQVANTIVRSAEARSGSPSLTFCGEQWMVVMEAAAATTGAWRRVTFGGTHGYRAERHQQEAGAKSLIEAFPMALSSNMESPLYSSVRIQMVKSLVRVLRWDQLVQARKVQALAETEVGNEVRNIRELGLSYFQRRQAREEGSRQSMTCRRQLKVRNAQISWPWLLRSSAHKYCRIHWLSMQLPRA